MTPSYGLPVCFAYSPLISFLPSSTRLLSRSHTAITRAVLCFQIPGRSCPREILPTPIAPMLMRLLGDAAPRTEAGTIDGKRLPAATDAAAAPVAAEVRN